MTLNVGVIGTGAIGAHHAYTLARSIGGARVTAVFDVDSIRADEIATAIGATRYTAAAAAIESDEVDGIVIAAPGNTHAELVLACLRAGKPFLCEKPLSTTAADCLAVIDAEMALGRRHVQVGFMRRFDAGYLQVKRMVASGGIGRPLVVHCVHRNQAAALGRTNEMTMSDSAIHEFDFARWMLVDEIRAISVVTAAKAPTSNPQLDDPLLLLIEMQSGVIVDAEIFGNCQFGYDVRCEIVGSEGVAVLENPRLASLFSQGRRSEPVYSSWQERFSDAYRVELQAWVDSVKSGTPIGPSSWDGYAATAAAEAAIDAHRTGSKVQLTLIDRPALYRTDSNVSMNDQGIGARPPS